MTDTTETIALSKANKTQLQAFARDHLGMTLEDTMTNEAMRAKVRQAANRDSIPVVAEPNAPVPAAPEGEVAAAPINVISEDTENERVRIIISATEEPGGDEPVFVSVNGKAQYVPRGEEVEIRRPYYEVLMNAETWRYDMRRDANGNPDGMLRRKVLAYPVARVA